MRHEGGSVGDNLARLAGDAQRPKKGEEPQMNTDNLLHVKCTDMWATRREVVDGQLRW